MYTVITQYYFILLCNALKCPVRHLVLDIPFILLSDCWCVCGYATLVIIQLFSSVEFVHSRKQLSIFFLHDLNCVSGVPANFSCAMMKRP